MTWVAAGALVLTLLAPYGVLAEAGWGERLAYWARTLFVGYLLYRPLVRVIGGTAVRLALPEWTGWVAALVLAAAPFSLWLWWFGPEVLLTRSPPAAGLLVETAGQVLLVSGLLATCLWFAASLGSAGASGMPGGKQDPGPQSAAVTSSEPLEPPLNAAFAARLPRHLGCVVWALKGEDHYVRVYTPAGDALVLMRMADAVAELTSLGGLQVHRSWWVAPQAVQNVERRSRQVTLVLKNGLTVPVARDRVRILRQSGWLRPT